MTLVYTGANFAYGNTQSSDIQIDARELIDGPVNIGPVGYRAWLRCRVEVVADANDSSSQSLHVYAKVSDYLDSGVAGGVNVYPKYYQRLSNGVSYCYGRLNEADASGAQKGGFILKGYQVNGGTSAGIFKNTSGPLYNAGYHEWTVYFDLGAVTPGSSVITPVYKVGWVPDTWRWSGESSLTMTPKTVTVAYDANASGESVGQNPSSQIRFAGWTGCGFSTEIASSTYQRSGWAFLKWNTEPDGSGADYNPGSSYAGTSDITLYAQWERTTKTLHYEENRPAGATGTIQPGVPADVTVDANVNIPVSAVNPAGTTNYLPPWTFNGWAYQSTASSPDFPTTGGTYTSQNSATLYAVWSNDYIRPSFPPGSSFVFRSTSSGQKDNTEGYLTATGTVVVNQTEILGSGNNKPESMAVRDGSVTLLSFSPSDFTDNGDGTWSFSKTSSTAILNDGTSYTLTVEFKDTFMTTYPASAGESAPLVKTGIKVPVAFITFSTNARGMSAAFGTQAAQTVTGVDNVNNGPGRLDVNMNTYFYGKVDGIPVDGTTIDYNASGQLSYIGTPLSCTKRSGGTQLESYDLEAGSATWPSQANSWGWREEKWSNGVLKVEYWGWLPNTGSGWNYNWTNLSYPIDSTPFVGTPSVSYSLHLKDNTLHQSMALITVSSIKASTNTTGFKFAYYNASAVSGSKILIVFHLTGWWQ